MEHSKIIIAYCIYLPLVIALTIFVSKSLFKNGRLFMIEIFRGQEAIALATNKLFEIGFYLINIGFALYIMKIYYYSSQGTIGWQKILEHLSAKLGGFTIYLGLMLFLNLYLFLRGRRKVRQGTQKKFVNPIYPKES